MSAEVTQERVDEIEKALNNRPHIIHAPIVWVGRARDLLNFSKQQAAEISEAKALVPETMPHQMTLKEAIEMLCESGQADFKRARKAEKRIEELRGKHLEVCTQEPCMWSCDAQKIDKELIETNGKLEKRLEKAVELLKDLPRAEETFTVSSWEERRLAFLADPEEVDAREARKN